MRVIVDTNIIFSAILNSSSKIGKLLTHSKPHFKFYSCQYLRVEILRHQEKLLKLTQLSIEELIEVENLVMNDITFINEELLPKKLLLATEKLVNDIDPDDIPFIALAKNLDAKLWT
jgi:predicted nucleic acid-binding protein